MKYAHCRGCGRELDYSFHNPEADDGLCHTFSATSFTSCTNKVLRFEEGLPKENRVPGDGPFWTTPAWSILIDQWLEAGAP